MKSNYYILAADNVKSEKPARKNDKSKNRLHSSFRDKRSSMKRNIRRRGRR